MTTTSISDWVERAEDNWAKAKEIKKENSRLRSALTEIIEHCQRGHVDTPSPCVTCILANAALHAPSQGTDGF